MTIVGLVAVAMAETVVMARTKTWQMTENMVKE
jgi:hypothetical protein